MSTPSRWPRLRRLLRIFLWMVPVLVIAGSIGGWFGYQWFKREILATIPADLGKEANFRFPCSVQVFAADGTRVDDFYLERRVWVPISEMPEHVWRAFVASEDRRFFEHEGVDPMGILRALVVNLRGGSVRQGGSTITQQLVKNLMVGKEKSYRRKMREAVLAYRLERELGKLQLLELYVNYIALGHGNYGVEAAAQDYFGISARELDVGQAAMLAGLVPAPSRYSPRANPELAAQRREIVLKLMVEQGLVSAVEASQHLQEPVVTPRQVGEGESGAAYITETRREIRRIFGEDLPFLEGLQVKTPMERVVQAEMEAAVQEGLLALESRQGARGPIRNIPEEKRREFLERGDGLRLDPQTQGFRKPAAGECFFALARDAVGGVDAGPFHYQLRAEDLDQKVRIAAGKAPAPLRSMLVAGDVMEVCLPAEPVAGEGSDVVHRRVRPWAESSAVAIENRTGNVVALVGGYDVGLEGFVRATQAKRQPGSSFKPFVYGAAIVEGRRQTDIVYDGPFSMPGTNGLPWAPQNYDGKYHGAIPLRTALALSLNTVAVRLGVEAGIEDVTALASRLGIRTPLRKDLTVALGSSEVTPMDLAVAYSSIARMGVRLDPVFLLEVADRRGRKLGAAGDEVMLPDDERRVMPGPPGVRAMDAADAYVLVDMMRNVFIAGTAKKGQRPGMDFGGKTGTTSDFIDAWFVGFSPQYTVAVWVGTDGTASIGDKETGGKTALPVWSRVMAALPNVEGERFPVPDDVVLIPNDNLWLGYKRGTAPAEALAVQKLEEDEPLPPFGAGPVLALAPVEEELVEEGREMP